MGRMNKYCIKCLPLALAYLLVSITFFCIVGVVTFPWFVMEFAHQSQLGILFLQLAAKYGSAGFFSRYLLGILLLNTPSFLVYRVCGGNRWVAVHIRKGVKKRKRKGVEKGSP